MKDYTITFELGLALFGLFVILLVSVAALAVRCEYLNQQNDKKDARIEQLTEIINAHSEY